MPGNWGSRSLDALYKMPELPEVETTCRGIAPYVTGMAIDRIAVRDTRLRWPVAPEVSGQTAGRSIINVRRRAKYILMELDYGNLIFHLGMSGSLRVTDREHPHEKHDHLDIALVSGAIVRYRDRGGSLSALAVKRPGTGTAFR